jgi:hypothetical protein
MAALERIGNGPRDEICIGWSYGPITETYFASQPDMTFYTQNDTVLLEFLDRDRNTRKIAWPKAILYGDAAGIGNLVSGFIARNIGRGLTLFCLCPEVLVPHVLELDFQYSWVWTGGHNIVVLFTKDLMERNDK